MTGQGPTCGHDPEELEGDCKECLAFGWDQEGFRAGALQKKVDHLLLALCLAHETVFRISQAAADLPCLTAEGQKPVLHFIHTLRERCLDAIESTAPDGYFPEDYHTEPE